MSLACRSCVHHVGKVLGGAAGTSRSARLVPAVVRAFRPATRVYSTQTDLEATLNVLPKFTTKASNVKVLSEPAEFYSWLLDRIANAKRRVFFSSLYLGKEEQAVVDALHRALSNNPQLTFHYIADYLRSTREDPNPCSASLLAPLKAAFPDRVHLSFWHTPELNGLAKRFVPKRFNEGWGLWHAKLYGADDEVLMSGANLSKDYFTNRQDRYMVIRHPRFADYAQSVVLVGQSTSFALQPAATTASDSQSFTLEWPKEEGLPVPTGRESVVYKARARESWRSMQAHWTGHEHQHASVGQHQVDDEDVEIRPFLQMGVLGIREETDLVVPYLLRLGEAEGVKTLDMTSGYFSLDAENQLRVLNSPAAKTSVICASPLANGFYQSKGVSKYIPPAYTLAERRFWKGIQGRNLQDKITLREWVRPGWTYHAKGIWLSSDENRPFATTIGSSNYGPRSAKRDIEVNVLVTTKDRGLQDQLKKEVDNIQNHAVTVTNRTFEEPDRKVGWGVRLAAWLIKDML